MIDKTIELEREIADLKNNLAILQQKIDEHNQECIDTCGDKGRCGYKLYKMRCPDCPRDWMIDRCES
jgi:hypothetical protein